jgi:hypothetical protein
MAREGNPQLPYTVPVTIHNCWWEEISREEAIRRLEQRSLDPARERGIRSQIPELTRHYLTFEDNAFREYVDPNDRPAELLVLLPLTRRGDLHEVIVPIYESETYPDGRVKHISGIDIHRYDLTKGKLIENDVERDTFRFSEEPVELELNIAFLSTDRSEAAREASGWCCDSCEWFHSQLDIHCADWLCCLGSCPPMHLTR